MSRFKFIWKLIIFLVAIIFSLILFIIPLIINKLIGPPDSSLGIWDRAYYSMKILWNYSDLTSPNLIDGEENEFIVLKGSSISEISNNLQSVGLIRNADLFTIYLIWKGMDRTVQAGIYKLNPGMSGLEVALELQDATPSEITFVVLPGWRKEEIATSLLTSGLSISENEFLEVVENPNVSMEIIPEGVSAEGFLFPGSYLIARGTSVNDLVSIMVENFSYYLTADISNGFTNQGLNDYDAIILASIIQREAIVADEQPLIASVFLNRLRSGMKLESDPTVQYALGYDINHETWWKNPLSYDDLGYDSPFNTYLYGGTPPAPISNPGLSALVAVAFPAQTDYFYFRARCDGSNLHSFAETYQEHLQNECN